MGQGRRCAMVGGPVGGRPVVPGHANAMFMYGDARRCNYRHDAAWPLFATWWLAAVKSMTTRPGALTAFSNSCLVASDRIVAGRHGWQAGASGAGPCRARARGRQQADRQMYLQYALLLLSRLLLLVCTKAVL